MPYICLECGNKHNFRIDTQTNQKLNVTTNGTRYVDEFHTINEDEIGEVFEEDELETDTEEISDPVCQECEALIFEIPTTIHNLYENDMPSNEQTAEVQQLLVDNGFPILNYTGEHVTSIQPKKTLETLEHFQLKKELLGTKQ